MDTIDGYINRAELTVHKVETTPNLSAMELSTVMGSLGNTYSACVKMILMAEEIFEGRDLPRLDVTSISTSNESYTSSDTSAPERTFESRLRELENRLLKFNSHEDTGDKDSQQEDRSQRLVSFEETDMKDPVVSRHGAPSPEDRAARRYKTIGLQVQIQAENTCKVKAGQAIKPLQSSSDALFQLLERVNRRAGDISSKNKRDTGVATASTHTSEAALLSKTEEAPEVTSVTAAEKEADGVDKKKTVAPNPRKVHSTSYSQLTRAVRELQQTILNEPPTKLPLGAHDKSNGVLGTARCKAPVSSPQIEKTDKEICDDTTGEEIWPCPPLGIKESCSESPYQQLINGLEYLQHPTNQIHNLQEEQKFERQLNQDMKLHREQQDYNIPNHKYRRPYTSSNIIRPRHAFPVSPVEPDPTHDSHPGDGGGSQGFAETTRHIHHIHSNGNYIEQLLAQKQLHPPYLSPEHQHSSLLADALRIHDGETLELSIPSLSPPRCEESRRALCDIPRCYPNVLTEPQVENEDKTESTPQESLDKGWQFSDHAAGYVSVPGSRRQAGRCQACPLSLSVPGASGPSTVPSLAWGDGARPTTPEPSRRARQDDSTLSISWKQHESCSLKLVPLANTPSSTSDCSSPELDIKTEQFHSASRAVEAVETPLPTECPEDNRECEISGEIGAQSFVMTDPVIDDGMALPTERSSTPKECLPSACTDHALDVQNEPHSVRSNIIEVLEAKSAMTPSGDDGEAVGEADSDRVGGEDLDDGDEQHGPVDTISSCYGYRTNTPDSPRIICLTNLSLDKGESKLLDLVKPFGYVVKIYFIKRRTSGAFQGTAYVKFSRPQEALNAAVRLNGLFVDGHCIGVRLHRSSQDQ